jgi:hypothetical protein
MSTKATHRTENYTKFVGYGPNGHQQLRKGLEHISLAVCLIRASLTLRPRPAAAAAVPAAAAALAVPQAEPSAAAASTGGSCGLWRTARATGRKPLTA